jgi:menaquinol-cytochrome c reductase iron-sulfur subunit
MLSPGLSRTDRQPRPVARSQRLNEVTEGDLKVMAISEVDTIPVKEAGVGARQTSRRSFLLKLGFLLNGIAALSVSVPVLGYVLSSFRTDGPFRSWISLGPLGDFPEKQTRLAKYRNPYTRPWDGPTADIPCWVRRIEGDKFQIFAINCTHLGCPVRWFQESHLFMCPCHGGAFYEDGSHASGPPPRGLYEYQYKVEDGQLWVFGGQLPTLNQPA